MSVILNGRVQDPARVLPFVVKDKCIIEPKGSENVKVLTSVAKVCPIHYDIWAICNSD